MTVTQLVNDVFTAAQEGNVERLKELLNQDASLANTENSDGLTPLGYAAHFGQKEAVALLLDYGAEINAMSHSKLSFIPSNTALHAAVVGKNKEVVALLIEKGADVNALDAHGHNPLQAAAFEGVEEIGELLIQHDADVSRTSGFGSALAIAKKNGKDAFVALLEKHGAVK